MGIGARVIEREDGYFVRGRTALGRDWDLKTVTMDYLTRYRKRIVALAERYLILMATLNICKPSPQYLE